MSITHAPDRTDPARTRAELPEASTPIDLTEPAGPASGASPSPEQAEPSATVRPTFAITDAAVACAVSRKTITRKLGDLAEHGAAKDDDGIWRIPVEALLAVGLHPGRSLPASHGPAHRPLPNAPQPTPTGRSEHVTGDMVTVPRDRWDDLRIRLARAEAEASERALALADARLALRALTAGPSAASVTIEHGHGAGPRLPAVMGADRPLVSAQDGSTSVDAATTPGLTAGIPSPGPAPSVAGSEPTVRLTDSPSGQNAHVEVAPSGQQVPPQPAADLASARSQAARTGGYVPAAGSAARGKRRWWHSK